MTYIRNRMILPILNNEKHDVIMVLHSYGGLPGGAAALGLSKKARWAQGKTTGVIGQIYYAALLQKGGDGTDVLTAVGGDLGPGFRPDVSLKPHRVNFYANGGFMLTLFLLNHSHKPT